MTPRPGIFISAVSKELGTARQLVANTLQFLGYEPVWQDVFGTEQGDLRAMLRQKIDACKGVVQLVGRRYGAEPPAPDETFGRVSYTQYEALYARERGKKVWYLFLDDVFPGDASEPEPAELQELQAAYRRRLQANSDLYHPLTSREALEASVLKLRDDLARLRRGVKQWAAAVLVLLVLLTGAVFWMTRGQQQEKKEIATQNQQLAEQAKKMADQAQQLAILQATLKQAVDQFSDVRSKVIQAQPGQSAAEVQQRTYAELGKQLGVDPKLLAAKLPQFAKELQTAPNASTLDRANAAYVAKDYPEAERLALAAAHEAQTASPARIPEAIKALELAGKASEARIDYTDALRRYRDAAQLTDRTRDPLAWAGQQWNIAYVLDLQGHAAEAEKTYRGTLEEYRRARGENDADVLSLRSNIAAELADEGRFTEAEAELREVLALRTRLLGPEHADTLATRMNLAIALDGEEKHAAAEAEYRAVLGIADRTLGPEDPTTLTVRSNLVAVLNEQGKHPEAVQTDREVLAARERVLGPEAPDTISSRINLAGDLSNGGQNDEAEQQFRTVLPIAERVLGPEHPHTLIARSSYANVLRRLGRYAEAETEYLAVLPAEERVFGSEHPMTLSARHGYASALNADGKFADAVTAMRPVLEHDVRALGAGNPETLEYATTLSWYQLFARDFAGALATVEAGLAADASNLHLETNHAHALAFLGRAAEAEAVYLKYRGRILDEETKKTWEQVILQDFSDLEKAGLTSPEFARVRQLFAAPAN